MRTFGVLLLISAILCGGVARAVVYVDRDSSGSTHDGTSWDTAFRTIQLGVNAATPNGEVWVADGIYVGSVTMGEGVRIYGGFLGAEPGGYETALAHRNFAANTAYIDGGKSVRCVTMAVNAVVDGFTIRNGGNVEKGGGVYCNNLGRSGVICNNVITANSAQYGGAAYCDVGSSPTIASNTIVSNFAYYDGGAIYCIDSSPTITDNEIIGNTGYYICGGIFCCNYASPTIANNAIAGNVAGEGGGLCCSNSSPIITNNRITNNAANLAGGAISCRDSASPRVTNNIMKGNSAPKGGAVYSYSSSSPVFSNNVITGNSATSQGGGIRCESSSFPVLTCNDVWSNTPDNYSGCGSGAGDISEDPLFADPGNGDYHLTIDSPCIDTGDNAARGLPYRDFEGDPRVCDGDGDGIAVVDMGVDEYRIPEELTVAPASLFLPGWVWFSIPLDPVDPDATSVLGFNAENVVYGWDDAIKTFLLCPEDFTDLAVGPSYLAFLNASHSPLYLGTQPALPYEHTLPAAGWSWVGVPCTQAIAAWDLLVRKGGVVRTPLQDSSASDPWLNWGWIYWDSVVRTARIASPFAGSDDRWLHPWYGYRVWANTENVTIIFP